MDPNVGGKQRERPLVLPDEQVKIARTDPTSQQNFLNRFAISPRFLPGAERFPGRTLATDFATGPEPPN